MNKMLGIHSGSIYVLQVLIFLAAIEVRASPIEEAAQHNAVSNRHQRLLQVLQRGNFGWERPNPFLPTPAPQPAAGALATSPSTGIIAWSWFMRDEAGARQFALRKCELDAGRPGDCEVVKSYYDGCVSVATNSFGRWISATGGSISEAVEGAYRTCVSSSNGCNRFLFSCSSYNFPDYQSAPPLFGIPAPVERTKIAIRADMLKYFDWVSVGAAAEFRCVYHILGGPKLVVTSPDLTPRRCEVLAQWCSRFTSERWRGGMATWYAGKPHVVRPPYHTCSIRLSALPHWVQDALSKL